MPTQTVEPVLGFTPVDIRKLQTEPKLTVKLLLEIGSCKDYVKTPLQTLDGIYVNQPKRFLPLAKEAKKLVEEFQKEQIVSQLAGLPPEKLLQEYCRTTRCFPKFRSTSPPHCCKRTFTNRHHQYIRTSGKKLITFPLINCTI